MSPWKHWTSSPINFSSDTRLLLTIVVFIPVSTRMSRTSVPFTSPLIKMGGVAFSYSLEWSTSCPVHSRAVYRATLEGHRDAMWPCCPQFHRFPFPCLHLGPLLHTSIWAPVPTFPGQMPNQATTLGLFPLLLLWPPFIGSMSLFLSLPSGLGKVISQLAHLCHSPGLSLTHPNSHFRWE